MWRTPGRRKPLPAASLASSYISCKEITLKIPDELASRARVRCLKLEVYIQENLAQQLGIPTGTRQPRGPQEIRAWLDSLAQVSDKIPPSPETIARDWIYQDHN